MAVVADPERITSTALLKLAQLSGTRALEIGCGSGRITFDYAEHTRHVFAIDPIGEDIRTANQNKPDHLAEKITFIESSIEDFIPPAESGGYDVGLYTFSL